MRTEEQVLALFAEANRVPDPKSLDAGALTGHLSAIEQRRTGMTELDEKRAPEERPQHKRVWGYAIAGVVALAAIVAIGLTAANSDEPEVPVATQPVAPPDAVVETTVAAEPEVVPTTVAVAESTPVTPENIVGLWSQPGQGTVNIRSDGTLQKGIDQDRETTADEFDALIARGEVGVDTSGTWVLDGDTLTFTNDGTAAFCEAGEIATMTVAIESGKLIFTSVSDPCWPSTQMGKRFGGSWDRHDPVAAVEPVDGSIPVSVETIVGKWVTSAGDGGMALTINADGTLQNEAGAGDGEGGDGGLWAAGTWTLEGDVLTFTADGSAMCQAGDVATMTLSLTSNGSLNIGAAFDPCWKTVQSALGFTRFGHTWTRTNP